MSIFSLLSKYVVETCTLNCHSFMYFVFPRAAFITFIRFIAAGARCRVAVGKKIQVRHHSADFIFTCLGITRPSLMFWKIEFYLSRYRGHMQPLKLQCCYMKS